MTDRIKALENITDPDFIREALDDVHDGETTLADYAAAVSRAQRAALAASQPAPDCHQPDLVTAQCCMCGRTGLSTAEDGGPECELDDGRWVCSRDCYDRAVDGPTPQDAALVPEIAALIEGAMSRESSMIWIIENTSQVRVRDLALDILKQQREALRAIAEGRA